MVYGTIMVYDIPTLCAQKCCVLTEVHSKIFIFAEKKPHILLKHLEFQNFATNISNIAKSLQILINVLKSFVIDMFWLFCEYILLEI